MDDQKAVNDARMQQQAFGRWENEGGAPASGREKHPEKASSYTVVYKKHPVLTKMKSIFLESGTG